MVKGENRDTAWYSIIDKEGLNGLPFLSHEGGTDPRVQWAASKRDGFNALSHNLPDELKFGRTSSGIVADGVEAQLIILEARLQGGTQADRDAVFAGLNALRAGNTPAIAPLAGPAPTTQDAAVTQLLTERAYWEWLTPLSGTYGTSTSIVIPQNERTNPNFQGCLATEGF